MAEYKLFQEFSIKDIFDTLSNISKLKDEISSDSDLSFDDVINVVTSGKKNKPKPVMSTSSLAKMASTLVMVFPVLCSRNISIDVASMVTKALEKNYVTMVSRVFASHQNVQGDILSVEDYIRQFYNNVTTKVIDLDDINAVVHNKDKYVSNNAPVDEAAMRSVIANDTFTYTVRAKKALEYLNEEDKPMVSSNSLLEMFNVTEGYVYPYDNRRPESSAANKYNKSAKDSADMFSKQVPDSDYRKANELMPSIIYISFTVKNGAETKDIEVKNGIAGVKAKMYPLGSNDIINHLKDKFQDRNIITNLVRAFSKETKFFKDFLFAVDKAKFDAMSMSSKQSSSDRMWKVLERRANSSRARRAAGDSNAAAASVTTLVISQDEVEYLRKNYNVDMEKVSNAAAMFDAYNFIGLVIVDEALEVAKFIFDDYQPSWDIISFTHLEREASDNTYKNVVKLMTKMS